MRISSINETPWTEVQGFLVAPRLRRITYASLRAPFIPEFKSSGFSGRFDKIVLVPSDGDGGIKIKYYL